MYEIFTLGELALTETTVAYSGEHAGAFFLVSSVCLK